MKNKKSKNKLKRLEQINVRRAFSPNPPKETLFINKQNEILFSQKRSLEILLNIIKKSQISLISEMSEKDKNFLTLKQKLSQLKEKLNLLLKEKNKIKVKLEDKNEIFKSDSVEKLFLTYELVEEKKSKIITEKDKVYPSEIDKIKSLNFEIENKIKKLNFIIKRKKKMKVMANGKSLDDEQNFEIYCGFKNENNLKAEELFTDSMKVINEKYDSINGQSERTKIEKELIQNQIQFLKKRRNENRNRYFSVDVQEFKEKINSNEVPHIIKNPKSKFENEKVFNEDNQNKADKIRCSSFEQLNQNNIFKEDDANKDINSENKKMKKRRDISESFHSSLYTSFSGVDSFVLDIEEEKNDKMECLNISNDNINTDYNSDKTMTNNIKNNLANEKINQYDNFIFTNVPDKDNE